MCWSTKGVPAFCRRPLGSQPMSHTNILSHVDKHTSAYLAPSQTSWRPCTHNPRLLHSHAPDAHLAWVQHLTTSSAVLSPTPPFINRLPHSTNEFPNPVNPDPVQCPHASPSTQPLPSSTCACGSSQAGRTAHGGKGGSHSTSSTASW